VVLEAIEVVVQVVASAVLEADSVEASEAAVFQAAGNPCKTPEIASSTSTYQSSG